MTLSKAFSTYNIPLNSLHVKSYEVVILLGTLFLRDAKNLENLLKDQELICFSPIEDSLSQKAKFFSKYEAGTEEGVLALLLDVLKQKSTSLIDEFLDELDIGYLSAESNVGEEEVEEIAKNLKGKKVLLLAGKDLEHHPQAKNLAKLFGMLRFYCHIDVAFLGKDDGLRTNYEPIKAKNIQELESFDGVVTYRCSATSKEEEAFLLGSKQFALSAKIQDGFDVLVKTPTNTYNRKFKIDDELKGTIALLPANLEDNSYRYEVSKITQIG